ncbi:MAG: hypothetical protein ACFFD7_06960 [Candidatus Thorarchaeota archaeon]
MAIIVPINHFLFPTWFHGDMGINFGDEFDLWAVWLIGAYSIGLGVGCFVAATDPMRYYATVLEIFIGTIFMAVVCIASVPILGTDPYQWTTYITGILLILFCIAILLIYPLAPPRYSRKDEIN